MVSGTAAANFGLATTMLVPENKPLM